LGDIEISIGLCLESMLGEHLGRAFLSLSCLEILKIYGEPPWIYPFLLVILQDLRRKLLTFERPIAKPKSLSEKGARSIDRPDLKAKYDPCSDQRNLEPAAISQELA
jgi:hypothetical protein